VEEDSDDDESTRDEFAESLRKAAYYGKTCLVHSLLLGGVLPSEPSPSTGRSALHDAAMNGHTGIVELLLAHAADPTARDYFGLTPLNYAAKHGYSGAANLITRASGVEWWSMKTHSSMLRSSQMKVLCVLLCAYRMDGERTFRYTALPQQVSSPEINFWGASGQRQKLKIGSIAFLRMWHRKQG